MTFYISYNDPLQTLNNLLVEKSRYSGTIDPLKVIDLQRRIRSTKKNYSIQIDTHLFPKLPCNHYTLELWLKISGRPALKRGILVNPGLLQVGKFKVTYNQKYLIFEHNSQVQQVEYNPETLFQLVVKRGNFGTLGTGTHIYLDGKKVLECVDLSPTVEENTKIYIGNHSNGFILDNEKYQNNTYLATFRIYINPLNEAEIFYNYREGKNKLIGENKSVEVDGSVYEITTRGRILNIDPCNNVVLTNHTNNNIFSDSSRYSIDKKLTMSNTQRSNLGLMLELLKSNPELFNSNINNSRALSRTQPSANDNLHLKWWTGENVTNSNSEKTIVLGNDSSAPKREQLLPLLNDPLKRTLLAKYFRKQPKDMKLVINVNRGDAELLIMLYRALKERESGQYELFSNYDNDYYEAIRSLEHLIQPYKGKHDTETQINRVHDIIVGNDKHRQRKNVLKVVKKLDKKLSSQSEKIEQLEKLLASNSNTSNKYKGAISDKVEGKIVALIKKDGSLKLLRTGKNNVNRNGQLSDGPVEVWISYLSKSNNQTSDEKRPYHQTIHQLARSQKDKVIGQILKRKGGKVNALLVYLGNKDKYVYVPVTSEQPLPNIPVIGVLQPREEVKQQQVQQKQQPVQKRQVPEIPDRLLPVYRHQSWI